MKNALPYVPGSECSGVIVYCKNKDFIGKKVSTVGSDGCWRDYIIGNLDFSIVFNDDADLKQISTGFINPLSAIGLVNDAELLGSKAVVNTAASSALGKMIYRLCKSKNIEVINIVRTQ
jgi:NADPH:quinone reductase-like Zn-dependent oxidoreductase